MSNTIKISYIVYIICIYIASEKEKEKEKENELGSIKVTTTLSECETFLKFHYLIENEKGEKLSEANTAQAVIEMKSLQTCFEMPEALKKALKA